MKLNKDIYYQYVIFFSITLVFLDAYEIFNIPISWLGMTFLLPLCLIEYKNMTNEKKRSMLLFLFVIMFIPTFFYLIQNDLSNEELVYLFLRYLNIASFLFVFLFSVHFFKRENLEVFIKNIKYFIYVYSIFTLYIFFAQIYDLYEPVRNRSNTNLYGDSAQSIFWLSEPHRAMGTFREPVFLITFFFPLVFIYLYRNKDKSLLISLITGLALGLSRSNYLKIFCLAILIYVIVDFLINNKVKLNLLLFAITALIFSTFGVLECNLNQDSIECLEYKEDANNIINRDSRIDSNSLSDSVVDIGNERLNVLKYFLFSIENIEPGSFLSVNTDYQEYSTININEEMYFSNRTLPKYLLQRYSTKNFGTGNYSLLKYDINVQNLLVFYTQSLGILFPLILFIFFQHFVVSKLLKKEGILFLFVLLFFFISPIEEVNAYYGLIIGITYNLFVNKELVYEKI
tara:strand:+ start:72 stop:1442 length:1371 start_codon:yes stop_codon:yes gene_type:complete